jgi:hypothetical protein
MSVVEQHEVAAVGDISRQELLKLPVEIRFIIFKFCILYSGPSQEHSHCGCSNSCTASTSKYKYIQEAGRTDREKDLRYVNCTMFFFAMEYLELVIDGMKESCLMVLPASYFPVEFRYPYLRLLQDPDNGDDNSPQIRHLGIKIYGHEHRPGSMVYELFVFIIDGDWQVTSRAVGWSIETKSITEIHDFMRGGGGISEEHHLYGAFEGGLRTGFSYGYLLLCSKNELYMYLKKIFAYFQIYSLSGCRRDMAVGDCTPVCPCWSDQTQQYILSPLYLPACQLRRELRCRPITLPRCPTIQPLTSIVCNLCRVRASNHKHCWDSRRENVRFTRLH